MNREDRKQLAEETIQEFFKYQSNRDNRLHKAESVLLKPRDLKGSMDNKGKMNNIHILEENVLNRVHKAQSNGKRVGVMNFASAVNPGGGFETGASAQEETLCRNSFLYFELLKFKDMYYELNRKNKRKGLYVSDLIYSKDVLFVKDELEYGETFVEPVFADVVTVAAPNKSMNGNNKVPIKEEEYTRELAVRIQSSLRAFKEFGCDNIILGAFGCGVFGNDPKKVAQLFKVFLSQPEFKGAFENIYFSIYGKGENLVAFQEVFGK